MVNEPPHYTYGDIEVVDYCDQVCKTYPPELSPYVFNAIKYLSRATQKEGKKTLVKQNTMCKDYSINGKVEVWKVIDGYENYAISNYGNVWSYNINRKMSINTAGLYSTVGLRKYKGAKQDNKLVHRLVAQAFIPNPKNKPQVNHIDENKMNNYFENLEWATLSENYGYNNLHERRVKTRMLSGYYDSEKFKVAIKNSAKTRSIPIKGINIKLEMLCILNQQEKLVGMVSIKVL